MTLVSGWIDIRYVILFINDMIMNTVTHNIQAALSRLFLALVLCIAVSACKDEFPLGEYGPIGDGTATVSATVSFEPFGSALDHSRAPGDAIKSIHTLYLLSLIHI